MRNLKLVKSAKIYFSKSQKKIQNNMYLQISTLNCPQNITNRICKNQNHPEKFSLFFPSRDGKLAADATVGFIEEAGFPREMQRTEEEPDGRRKRREKLKTRNFQDLATVERETPDSFSLSPSPRSDGRSSTLEPRKATCCQGKTQR